MAAPTDYTIHYPLREDANDTTGNHNGTVHGDVVFDGKKAAFAGNDGYIDTGFKIPAISAYTMMIWTNPNNSDTVNVSAISNDINLSNESIRGTLAYNSGNNYIATMGDDSNSWSSYDVDMSPYIDGDPHLVAVAINDTSMKLYVDGGLVQSYTMDIPAGTASNHNLIIGRGGDYDGFYLDGSLFEFKYFERELSDHEILDIYNEDPRGINIGSFIDKRKVNYFANIYNFLDKRIINGINILSFRDIRSIEHLNVHSFLDKRDIYTGKSVIFSDRRSVAGNLCFSRFFDVRAIETDPSYVIIKRVND